MLITFKNNKNELIAGTMIDSYTVEDFGNKLIVKMNSTALTLNTKYQVEIQTTAQSAPFLRNIKEDFVLVNNKANKLTLVHSKQQ